MGAEGLEYLLRSDNRTSLLVVLAEDQPLDKADLEARLSASQRTISRVLNDLTERGYLQVSVDGFRLTSFGATVTEAYRRCRQRTDLAEEYRPFLTNVDAAAVDLDPAILRGADLTVADDISPYAPLNRALELRRNAARIRVVSPFVEERSVQQLAARLERGDDLDFDVILPADLYEAVQSQIDGRDAFRRETESDAVRMFVHHGDFPLLFATIGDVAALGVSVDGEPYALVESTNERMYEWVDSRIDEYRAEAVPVEEYGQ